MTNLRWPQPRKISANWRSSQRIRRPWRYRLREEGNEDPLFRCQRRRAREAQSAHRPPESERLLPGMVFQQNLPIAHVGARRIGRLRLPYYIGNSILWRYEHDLVLCDEE